MNTEITKQTRNNDAYFTVRWSPIRRASKSAVIGSVPSVAGIFELYVVDQGGTPNLVRTRKAWYGGLRHALRELSDPKTCKDRRLAMLLKSRSLYFRYTTSDNADDLNDVLSYLASVYPRAVGEYNGSGRYREIFVSEQSIGSVIDI